MSTLDFQEVYFKGKNLKFRLVTYTVFEYFWDFPHQKKTRSHDVKKKVLHEKCIVLWSLAKYWVSIITISDDSHNTNFHLSTSLWDCIPTWDSKNMASYRPRIFRNFTSKKKNFKSKWTSSQFWSAFEIPNTNKNQQKFKGKLAVQFPKMQFSQKNCFRIYFWKCRFEPEVFFSLYGFPHNNSNICFTFKTRFLRAARDVILVDPAQNVRDRPTQSLLWTARFP